MGDISIGSGAELRAWRKRNHLTQQELSKLIGYSRFRISHIETKDDAVSEKLLEAVRKVDRKMNPKPSLLSETWEGVLQRDRKSNNMFNGELQAVESGLVRIFRSIPRGFEKKKTYYSALQIWICSFVEMQKILFEDAEAFAREADGVFDRLRKKVLEINRGYH